MNPGYEIGVNYLFAAYTIVWLLISGYVFALGRKQTKLNSELEELRNRLESTEK
ncbi:MAG: CcmD family protein [Calditrichaeota bacterium]|nr:MAG: CcmD family protein [Calditrichota bacterium]